MFYSGFLLFCFLFFFFYLCIKANKRQMLKISVFTLHYFANKQLETWVRSKKTYCFMGK